VNEDNPIDVYLGLDVGKGEHHATALTPAGKTVFDRPLPNTEPKLRELFAKLQVKHGTVLVVVDQPASIGALPLAVAREVGCRIAYLEDVSFGKSAVADQGAGDAGEGEEVVGFAFVAAVQSSAAGEPGHGAFDGPAVTAESLGGLDAFASDAVGDAA